jgi:hypothetical protein
MGHLLGSCALLCKVVPLVPRAATSSPIQGQYTDGLRAPFVIHPLNEIQKYDDEYIVVLGDWFVWLRGY